MQKSDISQQKLVTDNQPRYLQVLRNEIYAADRDGGCVEGIYRKVEAGERARNRATG